MLHTGDEQQHQAMAAKPMDLNEWAYKSIRLRILEHVYKPGEQLNIEELAKELNISRTPVREALLRLRQGGLVISYSRVGFFVCGITKKDFEEIFELRELIESYAAESYVASITDEKIQQLTELNKQCKVLAKARDMIEYDQCDTKFHGLLIRALQNKRIENVYANIWDQVYRMRMYAIKSDENMKLSIEEHQALIDALRWRDSELAGRAMQTHIRNVRDRLRPIVDFEKER